MTQGALKKIRLPCGSQTGKLAFLIVLPSDSNSAADSSPYPMVPAKMFSGRSPRQERGGGR